MIRGYELLVVSAAGATTGRIVDFGRLSYTQAVNQVGTLEVTLPPKVAGGVVGRDVRLEVWVSDDGRVRRDADTQYLISSITESASPRGEAEVSVKALSALDLLRRRIVQPHATVPSGLYNGASDDIIKHLCLNNWGTAVEDFTRFEPQVSVEGYLSVAGIVQKGALWRNLLQACQEIAQDALGLYFDVVLVGEALQLRTWTGARGTDRTVGARKLTVSPMRGTMIDAAFSRDYSQETNRVYAGGAGQGPGRRIVSTSDGYRGHLAGPFALREAFISAGSADTDAGLLAEGAAALKRGRPKRTVSGQLADSGTFRYGREWGFGDRLLAELGSETVECIVESVQVTVENGQRTVSSTLRADD